MINLSTLDQKTRITSVMICAITSEVSVNSCRQYETVLK